MKKVTTCLILICLTVTLSAQRRTDAEKEKEKEKQEAAQKKIDAEIQKYTNSQDYAKADAPQSSTVIPTTSFSKEDELRNALNGKSIRGMANYYTTYEGIKGTPFFNENWYQGSLVLANKPVVTLDVVYKFDSYKNQLWAKFKDGEERSVYSKDLSSFDLYEAKGKKIPFKKVNLPEVGLNNRFVVVAFAGKNAELYKDVKKEFKPANLEDKGLVQVGKAYDSFEESTGFFFKKTGDSPAIKMSLKKSALIEALNLSKEAGEEAEKFCKTNGFKGKLTEEEAAKLLAFIDSLETTVK